MDWTLLNKLTLPISTFDASRMLIEYRYGLHRVTEERGRYLQLLDGLKIIADAMEETPMDLPVSDMSSNLDQRLRNAKD